MKKMIYVYLAKRLKLPLAVIGTALLGYFILTSPLAPGLFGNVKRIADTLSQRVTTVSTPAPVIVEKLQKLNRLETVRQVSNQIVEAKSNSTVFPDFLAKDSLQMMVQTVVVGGVDMSRVSVDDVRVESGVVTVTLPQPELFDVRVDDEASRVYARQRGLFMFNPDKDLERQARLQAQANARRAAYNSEVMAEARTNAEEGLRSLLQSLGFNKIEFRWASA